ncbi:MAG: NADH-quinone oxidoreductase subunit J/K [Deltaproteobacteria bacterium]|nr:NADH-quinone oxidoreductase subunit J/K [Deltaproteobacteria bacterium]
MKIKTAGDLTQIKQQGAALLAPQTVRVTVGAATCGLARGGAQVAEALKHALKKQKIKADVVMVGSNGMAFAEPVVSVIKAGKPAVTYGNVAVDRAVDIAAAIGSGKVVEDLALYRQDKVVSTLTRDSVDYLSGKLTKAFEKVSEKKKVAFFKNQKKLISANAGTVNPESIEEAIALGSYAALVKALEKQPKDIIKEVKDSKLRGRGGAGFPTGIKWEGCSKADGEQKYIVCNGSEGDPEIGLHKSFLESDPHSLIEGMIIGGYAIGASAGYVYLNDKYLLAIERVEKAIKQAEKLGLLGKDILGSGFSFALKVKRGGGAYVCGEETALLNSLEGSFGEPRPRPPLPIIKGLFDKPTVVNNLETLATIPTVVAMGGKKYAGLGTPASKGTKIVALSGHVAQTCWVEVELGTTIEDIIKKFGNGTASGKKVKAFQTGGPSGGLLPAKSLKLKLDYDALGKAGSLLGSGGLLVMDEDADVVDMAKFLTDFFADESCGKCTPCREGVKQLKSMIDDVAAGRGTSEQLGVIKRMGEAMADTCFCALGKTAAAPILTVMKHFPKDVQKCLLKSLN